MLPLGVGLSTPPDVALAGEGPIARPDASEIDGDDTRCVLNNQAISRRSDELPGPSRSPRTSGGRAEHHLDRWGRPADVLGGLPIPRIQRFGADVDELGMSQPATSKDLRVCATRFW